MSTSGSSDSGVHVAAQYTSGAYFQDPGRHGADAKFKAECFMRLFAKNARRINSAALKSYTDVGCGSGVVVQLIAEALRRNGVALDTVKGYDVSPHVKHLRSPSTEFVHGDFCETGDHADLVTLFDVVEHAVDPIGFLKKISARCRILALHIPLDDSLSNAMRDKFRDLIEDPGHILFLDTTRALNLMTLAGLKIIAYDYTFGFRAPSGHASVLSKAIFPFRLLMSKVSPWLLSKTLGGASLMVIAAAEPGEQTKVERVDRIVE